jgi:hypothetical protein
MTLTLVQLDDLPFSNFARKAIEAGSGVSLPRDQGNVYSISQYTLFLLREMAKTHLNIEYSTK